MGAPELGANNGPLEDRPDPSRGPTGPDQPGLSWAEGFVALGRPSGHYAMALR